VCVVLERDWTAITACCTAAVITVFTAGRTPGICQLAVALNDDVYETHTSSYMLAIRYSDRNLCDVDNNICPEPSNADVLLLSFRGGFSIL